MTLAGALAVGACRAGLVSGASLVQERLAATWARRGENIAHRKDALTGVSEFPNLAEKPVRRKPLPAAPTGGLPRVRYAQAFEELRDRSDAQLAETGARPKVFLATLGPVAVHTGRSSFAANLFNAGGIETPAGSVAEFDGGVACVCSSDKLYAEEAAETVAALKAAGATHVFLAGSPKKWAETGADAFVFAGCDALSVLHSTYRQLEANR